MEHSRPVRLYLGCFYHFVQQFVGTRSRRMMRAGPRGKRGRKSPKIRVHGEIDSNEKRRNGSVKNLYGILLLGGAISTVAALDCYSQSVENTVAANSVNVLEYGARADGKTLSTGAIQSAIDCCAGHGGGTVFFPPGNYLSGTLQLKTNTTIYIEQGATLYGSKAIDDYDSVSEVHFGGPDRYFLCATDANNIVIEGRGTIDGQGNAFWESEMFSPLVFKPKPNRPASVVRLTRCQNVTIRDITIRNSPCYTVWLLGCDRANITGVNIDNPRKGPNTDGLDIDCSSNVAISNCYISAGDDCIALKSDAAKLGYTKACENVTVTNCALSSTACGVRIGYEGDAPIRNCTFANIVIFDTHIGIDMVSILPTLRVPFTRIDAGTEIDGIIFAGVVMDRVDRPIFIWMGREHNGDFRGKIENISIDNLVARTANSCYIGGMPEKAVRGVTLTNIRLTLNGEMKPAPNADSPGVWGFEKIPWGIYCRWAEDLKLDNLQIEWGAASGEWLGAIKCENVKNLEILNFTGKQFVGEGSAIQLRDVKGAFLHGCNAPAGTARFLVLEGSETVGIVLGFNNLAKAKVAFECLDGVPKDAVSNISNNLGP